jgi:hypothetical protein
LLFLGGRNDCNIKISEQVIMDGEEGIIFTEFHFTGNQSKNLDRLHVEYLPYEFGSKLKRSTNLL